MIKERDWKKRIAEICVFIVTLLVHIYFVFQMSAPQYVDEYRTFFTGEFLAGRDNLSLLHTFEVANIYYGFGQVLFYIPFFWLFNSIDVVFKAALIFNGIIMSVIPVLALKIFRVLLPDISDIQRSALAFAIGMFSPLIYSSKTVTNETFLLFFPVLILYLLVFLLNNEDKKRKVIVSALLGAVSMWMYTLNARGLAITVAVCVCVFYIEIMRKEKKIALIPFGISLISIYGINGLLKKYIIQVFHHPYAGTSIRNSNISLWERIKLFDISNLLTALSSDWGNWFYVIVISGGLAAFIIGIIFVKKESKLDKCIWIYPVSSTFITYAMLFFVNYNAYSNPKERLIDYYIYGRYYDLLIPILLIVGISFLIRYSKSKKAFLFAMIVNVLTYIVASTGFADVLIKTGSHGIRVLNIGTLTAFLDSSFVNSPKHLHFIGISIVSFIIFVVLYELAKKKKIIWLSLLFGCCFLFATIYVMKDCRNTSNSAKNDVDEVRMLFREYEGLNDEYKTIYYLYEGGSKRAVNVQYALRGWRVAQVDMKSDYNMDLNMIEENSFVLARKEFFLDVQNKDFEYVCEKNGMLLYAYGDELISDLQLDENSREGVSLMSLLKTDEINELVVRSGAQSYGPYVSLEPGTYYVKIQGYDLESAEVLIGKDYSTVLIDRVILEQDSNKIELTFSLDSYGELIEIKVDNSDKEYIVIENMEITDESNNLIFETKGGGLYSTIPANVYIMDANREILLEPVILDKGNYLITIRGRNMEGIKMECNDLSTCNLSVLAKNADYVIYELICSETEKYPSIVIDSDGSKSTVIKDVIIESISEMQIGED